MQQLQSGTLTQLNVGINSRMVAEVSGGPVQAKEVDLIEVGIGESGVLKDEIDYRRLEEFATLSNKFSIHGPYTQDYFGNRVNWGIKSNRNFEVMERVFKIADYLGAECIVLHGDQVQDDYREAFFNVVGNFCRLSKMAADYSVTLLLENVHRQRGVDRVGVLPHEVLAVIQAVNEENLKFCFDIGHGTLSAKQYGFDVLDFVTTVSPYLYHMHIHDNQGIPEVVDPAFGDQHLPLGQGKVEYQRIFQAIAKLGVKNMVLELRQESGREEAQKSIGILKALKATSA